MGILTNLLDQHAEAKQKKDQQVRDFYLKAIQSGNLSPEDMQYATEQVGKVSGNKESKGLMQQFGGILQHVHQKVMGGGQPPAQGAPQSQPGGMTPPPQFGASQGTPTNPMGVSAPPMSEQTPAGGSSTAPPGTSAAKLTPPPSMASVARGAFPSPDAEADKASARRIAEEKAKPITPSQNDIGKTVETGDGIYQFNPNTQRYDIKVGAAKKTATDERDEGKTVETGDGVMQFNPQTKRYDIKVGPGKKKGGVGGGSEDDDEAMVRDIAAGKATMPTGKYGAHLAGVAQKMGVDLPDTPHNATARDKYVQPLQKAIDTAQDAQDYASGSAFSGAGDDELMNKFQQMIQAGQAGTGIRFTKNEQDMLNKARSWQESIIARGEHALGGTYYSEKQRKEIAQTMQGMAERMKKQIADYDVQHGGGKLTAPPKLNTAGAKAPTVGTVESGYRFKGGDPSNKASWEKVSAAAR